MLAKKGNLSFKGYQYLPRQKADLFHLSESNQINDTQALSQTIHLFWGSEGPDNGRKPLILHGKQSEGCQRLNDTGPI